MRLKSGEAKLQCENMELQAFVEPTKSKISKERSLKVLQLELKLLLLFDVFILFPIIVNSYEIVRKLIKNEKLRCYFMKVENVPLRELLIYV